MIHSMTALHLLPDFQSLLEPFGESGDGEFHDGSNMNDLVVISGRRFLRRATETAPEEDSGCYKASATGGGMILVDDERCKTNGASAPIFFAFLVIILICFCWQKSVDDVSDAYWCCCRKCRRKRQREQQTEITTTTTDPIRPYDNTPLELEQRELQQRQLPIMASIRRRERQLHQQRLDNNARLEERKRKNNQETQVRRALLLSKFKEAGLEKILTIDDFVLNSAESDEIPRGDETTECTAGDKANENNCEGEEEPSESSANANGKDQCDQPKEEEQSFENPKGQTESLLRINWDQNGNGSLQTHNSVGKSSIATYPNECAICLQEYRPNDVIAVSDNPSCTHCYHRDCIVEYLIPLLDFEGKNDDSNENGGNTAGTESASPSPLSAPPSHGGKAVPCPCCRLPFLLDTPKIEESVSLPSL